MSDTTLLEDKNRRSSGLFLRILHHDIHNLFALDLLHPMRHACRHANEVAFGQMMFFAAGDALPTNFTCALRAAANDGSASHKLASAINHIPNVRLLLMHLRLTGKRAPKQNRGVRWRPFN